MFKQSRQKRFEKQVRPHLQRLYQYAWRLSGNADDAEDIVQTLLIRTYQKEIEFDQLENPRTWLLKSLYHQFIDFTRQQKRNPSVPGDKDAAEVLQHSCDPAQGPAQQLAQDQLSSQLSQVLNQLDNEHRQLVLLHDLEGYTLVEISQILETPVGTLKSRLHRSRKTLRELIRREPFPHNKRVNE
ncbi:hypothetical protein MNBD_GAMMA21-1020 [hydrothermal vent metagenome]|uniref:RNA polymerase ECF-type sigma factor n=1 Tax=hydrothermal vent metagenome TaxID=652676 RepID=A0A3B1ADQ4_9ZZZZ